MFLKFIFLIGAVVFAVCCVLLPGITVKVFEYLQKTIIRALRNKKTFIRWLYSDDNSNKYLDVKVYNDGWRKDDYR